MTREDIEELAEKFSIKPWEMSCDFCQDSILNGSSKIAVEELAKMNGWTVVNGKDCCKRCLNDQMLY